MCEDSRSKSGRRTLTPHGQVQASKVIPPALETDTRGDLVVDGHEERDSEVLRSWTLKGLFCQWMMTLNSGHDVSE